MSVVISRKLTDFIREREVWVYRYNEQTVDLNKSIKMEVGIENCLHLEFEYNKSMQVYSTLFDVETDRALFI